VRAAYATLLAGRPALAIAGQLRKGLPDRARQLFGG